MNNPYSILGLNNTASKEEAKKAFRRLAHIHHPDKGGYVEKFKEINNAYQAILKGQPQQPIQQYYQAYSGCSMQYNPNNNTYYIVYF